MKRKNKSSDVQHTSNTLSNQKVPSRQDQQVSWHDKNSVALLIDGENTSFRYITRILSHTELLGPMKIRRVYGDWSSGYLKGWEAILVLYDLQAHHHMQTPFSKNSTDIALVVDAMLLYNSGIRTFSFVASDSDYVPCIQALRSGGSFVMVLGTSQTPQALQKASSVFVNMQS